MTRRYLGLLVLGAGVFFATGADARPKAAGGAIAAPVPRPSAQRRAVEVLWGGSWWAAEVVERRGRLAKIHYVGWGSEWDEWVGPERVRAVAPRAPLTDPAVGQKLEVEWHGSWWPAQVIAKKNGFFEIHYTGWSSDWNEWVQLDRMRALVPPPAAKRRAR